MKPYYSYAADFADAEPDTEEAYKHNLYQLEKMVFNDPPKNRMEQEARGFFIEQAYQKVLTLNHANPRTLVEMAAQIWDCLNDLYCSGRGVRPT